MISLGLLALAACEASENKAPHGNNAASSGDEGALLTPDEPASPPPHAAAPPTITMPEFAPQYPGSTIKAVNSSHAGRGVHEVTLETQDDAAKIMDFYREKFSAGGLKKTSDFQSGGTGVMSAAAKDRKASIAITRNGTQNSIIVTFSGS
jgi:hypothetical protein